ncbi:MAG TPA: Mur ligase family protein, partial [Candidatus Limnocylindrales bacterium]|nr:Mur ligase family protein [Candidatus Limnocylindrales bacterium]
MRLIETRLLDGPNVYRLEPAAKLEVAIGPRRSWSGSRTPTRGSTVRLGARVPRRQWPRPVADLASWVDRLGRLDVGASPRVAVHRGADPGHWIVIWRWRASRRAEVVAEAAFDLARRGVKPARRVEPRRGIAGAGSAAAAPGARLIARWRRRIRATDGEGPAWIRDADRRLPVISISGTNGKTTTTRLVSHILRTAGRHVGTTSSDGVLVDERLVEEGDW